MITDIAYPPRIIAAYPAVHFYQTVSIAEQAQYAKLASLDFMYLVPHVRSVPRDV